MNVKKEDILMYYGATIHTDSNNYENCYTAFEYWEGIRGDFYLMTDIKRNESEHGRIWATADFTHFDPGSHLSDDPQDFEDLIREQIESGYTFYVSDDFEDVVNEIIEELGEELLEDANFLDDFPEYDTEEED